MRGGKMHKKRVRRPWGFYTVINRGKDFKVKLVEVLPGKRLSLQRHKHRSEHWVVVSGKAKIVNGGTVLILNENQSAYIPKMTIHRLENLHARKGLKIVEVQCGPLTVEADIERVEDDHGRIQR